jgi:hypothetical protein
MGMNAGALTATCIGVGAALAIPIGVTAGLLLANRDEENQSRNIDELAGWYIRNYDHSGDGSIDLTPRAFDEGKWDGHLADIWWTPKLNGDERIRMEDAGRPSPESDHRLYSANPLFAYADRQGNNNARVSYDELRSAMTALGVDNASHSQDLIDRSHLESRFGFSGWELASHTYEDLPVNAPAEDPSTVFVAPHQRNVGNY